MDYWAVVLLTTVAVELPFKLTKHFYLTDMRTNSLSPFFVFLSSVVNIVISSPIPRALISPLVELPLRNMKLRNKHINFGTSTLGGKR